MTGAKKYCLKCKDEQYIKTRLKSQKAFFDKIDQLDPIRKCLKCGEVKKHNARCNVCPDCYSPKYNMKSTTRAKSKEDALFESLLNRRIKELSIYGERIPKIRERKNDRR